MNVHVKFYRNRLNNLTISFRRKKFSAAARTIKLYCKDLKDADKMIGDLDTQAKPVRVR